MTRSQYKRSFHKLEDELITATGFSGHGPPRAHAHFALGGARFSCLLTYTYVEVDRPAVWPSGGVPG